jgi:acylphosphatase
VRNCQDGTLEAVVEGPPDAVERVVRFFRTGPPTARVEDVDVRDEQPEGLSGFEVR